MKKKAKTAILFVCMGNICRSPTAEGVFRSQAEAAGLAASLHIDSAGTHAYHIGEAPDPRSQEFAARRGIDLSQQRARKLCVEDFTEFDLLLAMDKDNLARMQAACPKVHQHKLKLMMDYASHSDSDIVPDPYYGGPDGFDRVLDYLTDASEGLLAALRRDMMSRP
ncbi:low molecular weight protein-tyrosine-phosphatase [Undibacterium sp. TS12]|uniref:low molecular weight protein-tyrosine-phosphatase n=1 Tax=Undibacterium sp. TS12 TaxID=2908202 RepID=UPI001F4CA701|nr:low molecular weight protein-tyrosine-phosphatase [Undibacterium sp. TS12]MCH8618230.1 low molecular weight phosphotyrosine protein phosphatase [Undibacterium sp. TS12]